MLETILIAVVGATIWIVVHSLNAMYSQATFPDG